MARYTSMTQNISMNQLYEATKNSSEKMFIIKQGREWALVQVDWDETEKRKARNKGEYHVKWYIRQLQDSEQYTKMNCRYWPLIRELDKDKEEFKAIVPVRPGKVERTLQRRKEWAWYQKPVDLFKDRIVGPFELTQSRVPDEVWTELQQQANIRGVDIGDLSRIVPLNTWKRGNRIANSQPS